MAISGCAWTEDAVISLVEGAKKLKALTLECIGSLQRTPTFSEDFVLEKLTFYECGGLKEIDCSIGKLQGLTDLTVEGSGALQKLPEQIGKLKHLQHLSLRHCRGITELPDSISKLNSLTKLHVSYLGITRLPDSIGTLQSLSSLELSCTGVAKLPKTMSNLSQLHELRLVASVIRELPKLPESLTTLFLSSRLLQTVPDLSNLTNLVTLILSDGTNLYKEESSIIQPCDLPWIGGGLSKLRKMNLCLFNVHATPTDWVSLTRLEEHNLRGLELQTLKQLSSNLRVLSLKSIRVEQVELDGLPQLEELTINTCELITRISIPSSSRELRKVDMCSCNKLVEVQFLGVLESMEGLYISGCESLERLVCLSVEPGCNELQATELTDGLRRVSLVSSYLKALQELHLRWCPELQEIQFDSALESLKEFDVRYCISLKRLGGLSNLKNLKSLLIMDCESLEVIEGIDELERLEELRVESCRSMGKIIDASSSKVPKECKIWIGDCEEVLDTSPTMTWETETGDPLSEEQDDGNEDDHNEADNMEDEDDEDNNVHEVLQLSPRPLPVSSVGDNDENNDIAEEGKGKGDGDSDEDKIRTMKKRGFCSCLTGLLMFIPWIMTSNEEKEEESNDEAAEEEIR